MLGFGIRYTAQGIRNPTKDWNPGSKFHRQTIRNPVQEPGIHGEESIIIPLHGATDNTSFALLPALLSPLEMIHPGVAASKRQGRVVRRWVKITLGQREI